MAEWSNGGMARMAEWHMEWGNDRWNGRMAEWQNGIMAEWHNGRMAGMADGMVEWQTEMATYVLFMVHT